MTLDVSIGVLPIVLHEVLVFSRPLVDVLNDQAPHLEWGLGVIEIFRSREFRI